MDTQFDVIVVGGSFAGLSAALMVARSYRKVLVVDAGVRRNRMLSESHGYLGDDGSSPVALITRAVAQLQKYPNATIVNSKVETIEKKDEKFLAKISDGSIFEAQRVILAIGVEDKLPAIPGLAERWGKKVFICPYCDGYELEQGAIGVLATSFTFFHQALLLPDWGKTTLFTNGQFTLTDEQMTTLSLRNVTVEHSPVVEMLGEKADVRLQDGRIIKLNGMFITTETSLNTPVAVQLGCALEKGLSGSHIKVNDKKETSVQGVFACGDAARPFGNIAISVADGVIAGSSCHQSLIFDAMPKSCC